MDETRLGQVRDFIVEARKQGQTYDQIRAQLLSSGWTEEDVNDYLPTAWQQAEAALAPAAAAPPTMPPAAAPPAMPPAEAPAYTPPAAAPMEPPAAAPPAYAPPAAAPVTPPTAAPVTPPAYTPPAQTTQPSPYAPGPTAGPVPGYTAPAAAPGYAAAPAEYGIGAWLTRGWAMFSSDMGTLIGAMLVAGLLSLTVILAPPMMAGLQRMLLKKYDGQPIAFGDLFEGFQFFGSSWGVFAVTFLVTMVLSFPIGLIFGRSGDNQGAMMIGNGISGLVGIVVSTFMLFAMPYVVDGRGGAIEAITASFNTAKSDFIIYAVMVLVCQILAGIGVIACIVGVFITAPWATASLVAVYRSRFPAGKAA